MLCNLCQKVRYPHAYWTKSKTWKQKHDTCLFRHHATYQELIDSADEGCELCNLFKPFVEYARSKANGSVERAESDATSTQGDGCSQGDPFEWLGETEKRDEFGFRVREVPETRIRLTDGIFYEDDGDNYRWFTDRTDAKYDRYSEDIYALAHQEEEEDIAAGLVPDPRYQHQSDKNEMLQWLLQDKSNYTGPEQLWITAWTFKGDSDYSYNGHVEKANLIFLSAGSIDGMHLKKGKTAAKTSQIQALDVSEDPKSENCFELVRTWLANCEETHQKCRNDWLLDKPTRLIDVNLSGNSRKCYLYTTDEWTDLFTEYATLSHCWGGDTSQMVKLQSTSLVQMQQSIDLTSLSRTFQDAVEIARGLKIPYIWIDALCIIQDSLDDWSKESPRMGQYYRGGKVMISAMASSSSQHGILQPRVPALPPVKLEVDCKDVYVRVALDATITVQQSNHQDEVRDGLSVTPLRKRGWTLQESVFAPRIIHYTSQQLVWQCKTCMTSEDNQYHWDCHNPKIRQIAQFMNLQAAAQDPNGRPGPREKVRETGWYNMVCAFSNRQLSYMSDMLPALSGLAHEVHELTGSTYLAGLWMESSDAFIRNLTWRVSSNPLDGMKYPLPPRPSLNGSPSWSWASISGCVEFAKMEESFHRLQQPHIDPRFPLMQTKASTKNQYGQVQGGRIALIGTCHVYDGPLTFAAVTARQKAKQIGKSDERIRHTREKRLGEMERAEGEHVKAGASNMVFGVEANADSTITTGMGSSPTEGDRDSDIGDDNLYLASFDWETLGDGFDFEAYNAANRGWCYGGHDLEMDIPDDKYKWTDKHLILFLGRWDTDPFEAEAGEEVGEQWFIVLKRIEGRDAEWDERRETKSGMQIVYEEPDWRSEFSNEEGEAVLYYERVGIAEAYWHHQLPITEEEGWTRRKFYFV